MQLDDRPPQREHQAVILLVVVTHTIEGTRSVYLHARCGRSFGQQVRLELGLGHGKLAVYSVNGCQADHWVLCYSSSSTRQVVVISTGFDVTDHFTFRCCPSPPAVTHRLHYSAPVYHLKIASQHVGHHFLMDWGMSSIRCINGYA